MDLNQEEKSIINALCLLSEGSKTTMFDVLAENYFINNALAFEHQKRRLCFFIDSKADENKEIGNFWRVLCLVEKLINEGYVSTTPYSSSSSTMKLVWKNHSRDPHVTTEKIIFSGGEEWVGTCLKKDGVVIKKCFALPECYYTKMELWFANVSPNSKLRDLKKNKFMTEDERQVKKSNRIGLCGVVLAIIGIVLTLVLAA